MISRRKFLEIGGAGLAAVPLLAEIQPGARAEISSQSRSTRQVFPLNRNWLYGGKSAPDSTSMGFDDSRFRRVTIPHTNRVLPWHSFDERSYQFVSIYRRHFKLPDRLQGRRVLLDFAGVMTAAALTFNDARLGEYQGGYTPFTFELTPHVRWRGADNTLAVEVDSTERKDIPPFGGLMDYLTFGGIYREVSLRVVPDTFIENVLARPVNVLEDKRRVDVRCFLNQRNATTKSAALRLTIDLLDDGRVLAAQSKELTRNNASPESSALLSEDLTLANIGAIELWDTERPKLYEVRARLFEAEKLIDEYSTRIGFRDARFTPEGFHLNGKHLKLRGLNRHQTYPYIGAAAPARLQRMDARILRQELKCNIVRTSHYAQSTHFLDACDELGLLVFEEIPGWQHIGDNAWQDISVRNVEEMIRRDWNHPSIILWGVRINESDDAHDFYTRTNAAAHALDDSRPTGGVRNRQASEFLEDVFTMNDFDYPLKTPNHPLYLNTEFGGHTFPTKQQDNVERRMEHALRHARVHNQIASSKAYAGGIGWCAFDYNTHANFGSGDHVCYHGVMDIFRLPKPAAGVYRSQCDPSEEIVLEPCFHWSEGDRSNGGGLRAALIASNCELLKLYINDELLTEAKPDRENFGHLTHPPFFVDLYHPYKEKNDLRIDGYVGKRKVISKTLSGRSVDALFHLEADDTELLGDGVDMTRIRLRVTDEHGNPRPLATGAVMMRLEGPGEIIGENPFALTGGVGAVWLRTKDTDRAGNVIRLRAAHPWLGEKTLTIRVKPSAPEAI